MKKLLQSDLVFFLFLIAVLLFQRFSVLSAFGFQYADMDQAIYWQGARDYAKGIFNEPYFYGQAYNMMIEAIVAVPFILMSMPANEALPLATTLIALFPYLLLAILSYKNGLKQAAILVLFLVLLLPIEYDMMSGMPRGFVNGAFITSLGCIPILFYRNGSAFAAFTFFSLFGFIVNQSSAFLSFPIGVLLLFEEYKNSKFYLFSFIGMLPAAGIFLWTRHYFNLHPNAIVHDVAPFNFKFERILGALEKVDDFFGYITPLFWGMGWILYAATLALAVYFFVKKNLPPAFSALALFGFITFSFGVLKTHDGVTNVFFSSARMFMAVPIVCCIFLLFLNFRFPNLKAVVFFSVVVLFLSRNYHMRPIVEWNAEKPGGYIVSALKVSEITKQCVSLHDVCRKNNVDIVVMYDHYGKNTYPYFCDILSPGIPPVIRPEMDRRTKLLQELYEKKFSNILFVDYHHVKFKYNVFPGKFSTIENREELILLKNESLSLFQVMDSMKLKVRKF